MNYLLINWQHITTRTKKVNSFTRDSQKRRSRKVSKRFSNHTWPRKTRSKSSFCQWTTPLTIRTRTHVQQEVANTNKSPLGGL
ncbi:hypothetical protein QTP88_008891 [Uroleucon formosanum]